MPTDLRLHDERRNSPHLPYWAAGKTEFARRLREPTRAVCLLLTPAREVGPGVLVRNPQKYKHFCRCTPFGARQRVPPLIVFPNTKLIVPRQFPVAWLYYRVHSKY